MLSKCRSMFFRFNQYGTKVKESEMTVFYLFIVFHLSKSVHGLLVGFCEGQSIHRRKKTILGTQKNSLILCVRHPRHLRHHQYIYVLNRTLIDSFIHSFIHSFATIQPASINHTTKNTILLFYASSCISISLEYLTLLDVSQIMKHVHHPPHGTNH